LQQLRQIAAADQSEARWINAMIEKARRVEDRAASDLSTPQGRAGQLPQQEGGEAMGGSAGKSVQAAGGEASIRQTALDGGYSQAGATLRPLVFPDRFDGGDAGPQGL
jgi:hypothetical protein